MLRARRCVGVVIGGLAIGISLFSAGCGGSRQDDPFVILTDFQQDNAAAIKKYQGKTVRLTVEKVTSAGKSGKALEFVTVQGQVGKILIDATVDDPAEQEKALALKIGAPATLEGEPSGGMGELRGAGALFLKSAKVVP